MKQILLSTGMVIAMLLSFLPASAYDFEADGIYYDIKSFTELTVTAVTVSDNVGKDIVIPTTVDFNGKTLRVTDLGGSFAQGNTVIETVDIDGEIEMVSQYAFADCSELRSVTLKRSNAIGIGSFMGCIKLSDVELSNSLVSVGNKAFSGCTSLESLALPETLTHIGESAFLGCIKINNLDISAVLDIPSSAFEDCCALTNLKISDSLNSIGSQAFKGTPFLKFTIPSSVTNVGQYVFSGCHKLESVSIGNGITALSTPLFEDCPSLTELIIEDGESPLYFSYITGNAKYTSPHNPNSYSVNAYGCFEGVNLKEVYIGRSLKCGTVGYKTYSVPFLGNETIEKITIGPKVNSIPLAGMSSSGGDISESTWAEYKVGFFQGCSNLKEVTILGGGLKHLSNQLFEDCVNLSTITLGYGVSSIGSSALSNCDALSDIIFYSEIAPSYQSVFPNSQYINCKLSIPVDSEESYKSTSPWENFWNIEENPDLVAFFVVNDIQYEVIQNNEVQIIGTTLKEKSDIELGAVVTYKGKEYSVVDIAEDAFAGNQYLLSITIPNSISVIKDNQFKECKYLTQVNLLANMQFVGNSAFENCVSLSEINIPNTLKKIGDSCFKGCNSLASLDFSDSKISNIPTRAFYDCKKIQSLVLPNSVIFIGDQAFYNCESLTSLVLRNVETIGNEAFYYCKSIERLEVPLSCKVIGNGSFSKMLGLKNVTIEAGNDILVVGHNNDLSLANTITPFPNPTNVDERRTGFRNGYYDGLFYGLPIERLVINRDIELPKYYERTTGSSTSSYSTVYNDIVYYPPFYGLSNLKYVEIGENVSAICKNQIEAVVNAKPTTMEYTNFGNCDNIEVVVSNNPNAPIGGGFSQAVYDTATLFLPNDGELSYKADKYWKNFSHISQSALIPIESISFATDELMVDINASQQLEPIINPNDASLKNLKWGSSNSSVVKVSDDGIISSTSRQGEATITATACDGSGKTAILHVVVKEGAGVDDILIDGNAHILIENDTIIISGKSNEQRVDIYTLSGQLIKSTFDNSITITSKGVYIVSIGSHNYKVII